MIDRSLDGVNFTPLTTVASAPASYQDNGLVDGSAYYYRVRSHSVVGGNSDYSNMTVGTTPPLLVITSPADYQAVTNATVIINGTALGANGLQSLTVNGQAAVINGTNWSASVTVSDGTNTLTVVATDNSSDHNSTTQIIHAVYYPVPVASFTGTPTAGTAPLTVNFTDTSTGTINNRTWTFGDGATSTAVNPAHTYAAAGTYSVNLSVTGPSGSGQLNRASYITVTNVVVDVTPPVLAIASPVDYQLFASANFTVSGTASDASGVLQVTVNGQLATLNGNNWSLGITLALETNTLTVVATDSSANRNSTTQIVHAIYYPVPVASFTGTPTTGAAPLPVNFTDASTGTISSRTWTFGDGATSTAANPAHTYAAAGTYSVNL